MENNYWVGVVLGCTLGIILSLVGLFCIIKQNDDIQGQVLELRAKVAEHEKIIKQPSKDLTNFIGLLKRLSI